MNERGVGSPGSKGLFIHRLAFDETGGVGLTQGDVACGVLVEQGVPEENAGLGDGRGVGDEGYFAEATGSVIGGDETIEGFLAGGCGRFDDDAVDEAAADVLDEGALVGERLRGAGNAIDAVLVGSGEALFGGDVGVAEDAVGRSSSTSGPEVVVGEAHSEIGAGALEVERVEALLVELVDARLEEGSVGAPVGHGVWSGDAGGGEDSFPELGNGLVEGIVGEDELRPFGRGAGDDGPVDLMAGDRLHRGLCCF